MLTQTKIDLQHSFARIREVFRIFYLIFFQYYILNLIMVHSELKLPSYFSFFLQ